MCMNSSDFTAKRREISPRNCYLPKKNVMLNFIKYSSHDDRFLLETQKKSPGNAEKFRREISSLFSCFSGFHQEKSNLDYFI